VELKIYKNAKRINVKERINDKEAIIGCYEQFRKA
jgi:hypothetical protein